ncbi:transmembrane protein, putative (macronuclear) [Tetrahymena thermophila SB210]|uniref:Transmembrane protein, putative n=1 Tax=Tetrahymena thermophila (strain SB210) TaxID=312017 RepID=I7M7D0_TETTS|nr:transmembrane protein, putative [Tetrahymena thermophila SB210]EAR90995.2 transmembrane protein, putative [Tetrahymena thermophila SB210]|eukprot:XP_001011240.2 transmembrane protein, putative [Tetrahymena thermophila SB210]
MKDRLFSFRIVSRIILLTIIIGTIMVIYNKQQENFLANETSFFKKNQLESNVLSYTELNKKCMQACSDADGINCGKVSKNCCKKRGCLNKIFGEYCTDYIAIIGCTTPS